MDEKNCKTCTQSQTCQTIYEKLGSDKVPSAAKKATIAFLLPMVVFITVLAVVQTTLTGRINNDSLRTLLGFVCALATVCICVTAVKIINKPSNRVK